MIWPAAPAGARTCDEDGGSGGDEWSLQEGSCLAVLHSHVTSINHGREECTIKLTANSQPRLEALCHSPPQRRGTVTCMHGRGARGDSTAAIPNPLLSAHTRFTCPRKRLKRSDRKQSLLCFRASSTLSQPLTPRTDSASSAAASAVASSTACLRPLLLPLPPRALLRGVFLRLATPPARRHNRGDGRHTLVPRPSDPPH